MEEEFALVTASVAPMYEKPDFSSGRADEVLHGMKVRIIGQPEVSGSPGDGASAASAGYQGRRYKGRDSCWYLCETHYRYSGYIHGSMLVSAAGSSPWDTSDKCVVYDAFADILSENRIQSEILMTLTRGAQLRLLETADDRGYVRVMLADGRRGFVKQKFVGPFAGSMYEDSYRKWSSGSGRTEIREFLAEHCGLTEQEFRERVAAAALLYLGTQYRWGGKTPLGIDCSGLCAMAYMLNGIVIYRDASIREGFPVKSIDADSVGVGDLLYYKGHMAMYLGDGSYVHSTGRDGSDGVVVSSMDPLAENYRADLGRNMLAAGSLF